MKAYFHLGKYYTNNCVVTSFLLHTMYILKGDTTVLLFRYNFDEGMFMLDFTFYVSLIKK